MTSHSLRNFCCEQEIRNKKNGTFELLRSLALNQNNRSLSFRIKIAKTYISKYSHSSIECAAKNSLVKFIELFDTLKNLN